MMMLNLISIFNQVRLFSRGLVTGECGFSDYQQFLQILWSQMRYPAKYNIDKNYLCGV